MPRVDNKPMHCFDCHLAFLAAEETHCSARTTKVCTFAIKLARIHLAMRLEIHNDDLLCDEKLPS